MSEPTPDLKGLLALANRWREHTGHELLGDLLPSTPDEATACLIANAYNTNGVVDYGTELCDGERVFDYAKIYFASDAGGYDRERTEAFAEFFGYRLVRATMVYDANGDRVDAVAAVLPGEIGVIAWLFDRGEFPEYEIGPVDDDGYSEGEWA